MVHLSVQFNVLYYSPWRSKILRQRKSTLIHFVCPTTFIMQLTNVCVLIPFLADRNVFFMVYLIALEDFLEYVRVS